MLTLMQTFNWKSLEFVCFQHEGWSHDSPTPLLAATRTQPLLDANAAVANLLKRPALRRVLDAYGVTKYWEDFVTHFYAERSVFGDGSALFRSMMRKLIAGATQATLPAVAAETSTTIEPDAYIRQKICEAYPTSFMPNYFKRPSEGSLVAVYLTKQRLSELELVGFRDFEPLIAVVRRVIDSDTFEVSWMEAQPIKGPALDDGLQIGYNGRWTVWGADHVTAAPTHTIKMHDIYANDFKLFDSKKMSGPLKRVLKKLLAHAKGDNSLESEESEDDD